MREGYYATRTSITRVRRLLQDRRQPRVVMQVFQKKVHPRRHGRGDRDPQALLARLGRAHRAPLYDGDRAAPWETVMTIEGDYTLFAHLETAYLGVSRAAC